MVEGFLHDAENLNFHQLFSFYNRNKSLGDWSVEGTPGPIPNPEVKLDSADGTWRETARESSSSPRGLCHTFRSLQKSLNASWAISV